MATRSKLNTAATRAWIEHWNGKHRIGTRVYLKRGNGEQAERRTSSAAYVNKHGSAAVILCGERGINPRAVLLADLNLLLTCSVCGCDDLHACKPACSWQTTEPPLCTSCAD